jgi:hypothetical protein
MGVSAGSEVTGNEGGAYDGQFEAASGGRTEIFYAWTGGNVFSEEGEDSWNIGVLSGIFHERAVGTGWFREISGSGAERGWRGRGGNELAKWRGGEKMARCECDSRWMQIHNP